MMIIMNKVYNIAVILTCFNRKEKTLSCLEHLYKAQEYYNAHAECRIDLSVYLTDDGCTDGTAEAVRGLCSSNHAELHIIEGDGNCFWAGGMRLAWREALKDKARWHFYLLLNDDTIIYDNVFSELMSAHSYSLSAYGKSGIYSGITEDIKEKGRITYGGDIFESSAKAKWRRVGATGTPQMVDQTNANILLVSKETVDVVGIFWDGYVHSCADYDYGMMVRRSGIPALVTADICGACEYDHITEAEETMMLVGMSLAQRKKYVNAPTHSDNDYLAFVRRNIPGKFLVSLILRKIRLYFPRFYYDICKFRGVNSYN